MLFRRKDVACALALAALTTVAAGCGTTTSSGGTTSGAAPSSAGSQSSAQTSAQSSAAQTGAAVKGPLKVTFLYAADPSAQGWANRFDVARKAVQTAFGGKVETSFKENVPDGPQGTPVIDSAINSGANLIVGTSYGEGPQMIAAAKAHPNVHFLQSQWVPPKGLANFSGFDNAPEDGYFLTGMAAGAIAANEKNPNIGYVDAFLIPYDLRQLNAFALGARKMDPGVKVHVVLTNSWTDASKTLAATNSLLSTNVSVLGDPLSDTASGNAANQKRVPWFGGSWDNVRSAGPKTFITAPVWDWQPLLNPAIDSILKGAWKSQYYYLGMKNGAVTLGSFGPVYDKVTASQRAQIQKEMGALKSGQTAAFEGPITDSQGKQVVAAGTAPTVAQLETMAWVAPSIEGATLPKG